MIRFSNLLDRLIYTSSRTAKLKLLSDYFAHTPDPDRGWALAALTGSWERKFVTPALVRRLIESRTDPVLFRLSYDYVGDLAETVSLMWPDVPAEARAPSLSEVVTRLQAANKAEIPEQVAAWLDVLPPSGRFGLLKFLMGGLRVGVSARLAKTALSHLGTVSVEEVEELWFGLAAPYEPLFAWAAGEADRPDVDLRLAYRPVMLANPLDEELLDALSPADFAAETKWDGVRVQLVANGMDRRIYTRNGEDISATFPDILDHLTFNAVLDGELLVKRGHEIAPFGDVQQRLNRKRVTKKILLEFPAHVRLYDLLFLDDQDLRALPLTDRRHALEKWASTEAPACLDLSDLVAFTDWQELTQIRQHARAAGQEGVMLKNWQSPYLAGRPKGHWYKWKRDPLTADCVLLYAQRGHGKRSSYYSDFTFGCWREGKEGRELVPVGKAYSGFTDDELIKLDRWVRNNTTDRFGPVRAVKAELVVEVAFDAVQNSKRHKSGIALRFPRFHRIRWEKSVEEADCVQNLMYFI